MDFMEKLAALVPKPRINLTRYHGVLAPNSAERATVVPSGRGRRTDNPDRRIGKNKPKRKELGSTAETRVQDRPINLRALWRQSTNSGPDR